MRLPTDTLRAEHALILRMLDLLERAAAGTAPDAWWQEALRWLREFADAGHHGKEEGSLFPAMAAAGVPVAGGPIAIMLDEHEQGRALIREMATAPADRRAGLARRYGQLLREHIEKEDSVLFPMAEGVIDEPGWRSLAQRFETAEAAAGRAASRSEAELAVARLADGLARG